MIKAFSRAAASAWRSVKEVFDLTNIPAKWFGRFGGISWTDASYKGLAKLAAANPYARRSIELIATNMAAVELRAEVERGGETDQLPKHPVLDLLNRPNPRHSRSWFFEAMIWHLMCAGEFFLLARGPETGPNAGRPRQLHLIQPDRFFEFEREAGTGMITGYEFNTRPDRRFLSSDRSGTVTFSTDEMLHVFTFNPLNPDRGLPILLSALRALDGIASAEAWNKSISDAGGRIPGWFNPRGLENGQQLTKEQQAAAEKALQRMYKNLAKESKPGVLSGAFDFIDSNVSPREAEFIESQQLDARKIAVALGIDPNLLGDTETKTYSNFKTALRMAYVMTILPLLAFILDELNNWLMPKFDAPEGAQLAYDAHSIEALQEDANELFERLSIATGTPWMTPDEARQEIGLEAMGLEDVYLPFNVRPAGETLSGLPDTSAARHIDSVRRLSDEALDEMLTDIESNGNGHV